jgi:hypothetical protein
VSMSSEFLQDFHVRPTTMDDLEPVLELVNACYKVDYNEYWSVRRKPSVTPGNHQQFTWKQIAGLSLGPVSTLSAMPCIKTRRMNGLTPLYTCCLAIVGVGSKLICYR